MAVLDLGSTSPTVINLNSVYLVVGILTGLVVLFGGGSILGVVKWLRKNWARDDRLDDSADTVLGNKKANLPPLRDVIEEDWKAADKELEERVGKEIDRIWRTIPGGRNRDTR